MVWDFPSAKGQSLHPPSIRFAAQFHLHFFPIQSLKMNLTLRCSLDSTDSSSSVGSVINATFTFQLLALYKLFDLSKSRPASLTSCEVVGQSWWNLSHSLQEHHGPS